MSKSKSTFDTDEVYLSSKRHMKRMNSDDILEIHKSMIKFIDLESNLNLIDIGCGFGEFLKILYAKSNLKLYGLEKSSKLAKYCQDKLSDKISIFDDDLIDFAKSGNQKYNYITLSGVHPTIRNLDTLWEAISKISTKNTKVLINGPFSRRDVSLYAEWKYDNKEGLNTGWDLHSFDSIQNSAKKYNFQLSENDTVEVPVEIKENKNDISQFNIISNEGKKYYMNGLGLFFSINTLVFNYIT